MELETHVSALCPIGFTMAIFGSRKFYEKQGTVRNMRTENSMFSAQCPIVLRIASWQPGNSNEKAGAQEEHRKRNLGRRHEEKI